MDDGVRNFLRTLFRGVHEKYLGGYVAMCEFAINLKRVTPPSSPHSLLCTNMSPEVLRLHKLRQGRYYFGLEKTDQQAVITATNLVNAKRLFTLAADDAEFTERLRGALAA